MSKAVRTDHSGDQKKGSPRKTSSSKRAAASSRSPSPSLSPSPSKPKPKANPWTTLKTKRIYENPWIRVSESKVLKPNGAPGIYGVVHFRNVAVGVLAINPEEKVLMVGQFRYPLKRYSWEIPEGGCPLGTSALATAKRELREETGYRAKKWSKLLGLDLSNSCTDEVAEVFLAQDLKPGRATPEDTEDLRVKWVPFSEAMAMVERGEIRDAISVAALLKWACLRRQTRAPKRATSSQRASSQRTS